MSKGNKRASGLARVLKGINRAYWVLIALIVVGLCGMFLFVHNKYEQTLDWKKSDNSLKMAAQSLDMLYDSNETSRANKLKFTALYHKMINSDGSLTDVANISNLKILKNYMNNMETKNSDVNYKKMYGEAAVKVGLSKKYEKMFLSPNRIAEDVTPKTISDLNEQSFVVLSKLFSENNEDKFVSSYLAKENKLISDVDTLNELYNTVDNAIVINGNTVTLKPGYHDDLHAQYSAVLSKLKYGWSSTKALERVILVIEGVNKQTSEQYAKYDKYTADIAARDRAIAEWEQTKQEFLDSVRIIHEHAVEKKHEAEKAEAERKALEGAKTQAHDYIATKLPKLTADEIRSFGSQVDNANSVSQVYEVIKSANFAEAQHEADEKQKAADDAKAQAEKAKKQSDEAKNANDKSKDKSNDSAAPKL